MSAATNPSKEVPSHSFPNVLTLSPAAVLVPQRQWTPAATSIRVTVQPPIRFSVNGSGYVALSEAVAGRLNELEHGTEPAFSDSSHKKSFRLEMTVRDSTKEARSITVAKLAKKIGEEMKRFIERNSPIELQDLQWKVGEGHITLDRLLLVEVQHVSDGSIQPVLKVLTS
ncbi:hypothetical protein B0H21DRAFT_705567 [Amylocystis lapponica]|nr:hypothetical protein B0H21DRAFT_705567 [Amylocystis lapponica]